MKSIKELLKKVQKRASILISIVAIIELASIVAGFIVIGRDKVIGIAMLIAGVVATVLGLLIPFSLQDLSDAIEKILDKQKILEREIDDLKND